MDTLGPTIFGKRSCPLSDIKNVLKKEPQSVSFTEIYSLLCPLFKLSLLEVVLDMYLEVHLTSYLLIPLMWRSTEGGHERHVLP